MRGALLHDSLEKGKAGENCSVHYLDIGWEGSIDLLLQPDVNATVSEKIEESI